MGQSSLDRIAQLQKSAIGLRLDRGAEILGRFWREGIRCKSEWRSGCTCGLEETDFCRAKMKWIALYIEHVGFNNASWLAFNEPFGVIEAMTVRQALSTGLTFQVKNDMTPTPIKVGPKGTDWKTLIDLAQLDSDDLEQGIAAVLAIQAVGL